jgi:tetratricopeptide (TPR) repeat protein
MVVRSFAAAAALAALIVPATAHEAGRLGKVNFSTSCAPAAQQKFNLAMAYQHSFWYRAAYDTYQEALKADAGCAMAYWGIALTRRLNPFTTPTPQALAEGLAALEKGLALPPKTEREKDYLEALAAFYREHDKRDHRSRLLAHATAMEKLAARYPDDPEAQLYYALALSVAADPSDKTYANQLKAAKILEKVFAAQPQHPGVAHYLIHAYDYPAIAKQGVEAARSYAKIAPDSPHALHMPSHIFTRLGYWQESIETNSASAAIAKKQNEAHDQAHALDYVVYAYLQMGRDKAAAAALTELKTITGFNPDFPAAPFALAAGPARYALERGAWSEAAALSVTPSKLPYTDAITHFARAVGAARTGRASEAKADSEKLAALVVKLREARNAYWAEQVEIQQQAALAWIAYSEGRHDDAIATMRQTAEREDRTEKHPVTPGPLLPAREMLAEMLLDRGRAVEALKEFEAVLVKEPNRFRTLSGAARAAERGDNVASAKTHYLALLSIAKGADGDRPDLVAARAFIAK